MGSDSCGWSTAALALPWMRGHAKKGCEVKSQLSQTCLPEVHNVE